MVKQEYAGADEDGSSTEVGDWIDPNSPLISSALKSPTLVDRANSIDSSLFVENLSVPVKLHRKSPRYNKCDQNEYHNCHKSLSYTTLLRFESQHGRKVKLEGSEKCKSYQGIKKEHCL